MKNKKNLLFLIGAFLLFITFCTCMSLGASRIDMIKVLKALLEGNISDTDLRIFVYVRLPRCAGAVLSGMALAVSGVLIQAVLNNPMAAPGIIGVNSGAAFAVIMVLAFVPDVLSLIPASAFLGALLACLLIFALSRVTGAGRITITLIGIAVTNVLNAGINTVKTLFPNSVYNHTAFSVGGLGGVNIKLLSYAIPVIILCFGIAVFLSRNVDILCLGEETASNLGMNVTFQRFLLLIIASALAGCAVSLSGLIGFVGLVVPHIVRSFVGNKHIYLIPLSALFGAEFVLLADLFCRVAFRPYEIPVGIVLSLFGGCFFVFLILFHKRGNIYD